jgi:hypothetical protein
LSSALKAIRCGCFVPDLTRFTAPPCEGARRNGSYQQGLQMLAAAPIDRQNE